eukprot:Sspe_Gene.33353::Locus_16286_Transcript_1_1_Confidence_1.000_Length_2525::g.33353::m.33353
MRVLAALLVGSVAGVLGMDISIASDGAFTVAVNGAEWLKSGEMYFRHNSQKCTVQSKTLEAAGSQVVSGQDVWGSYKSHDFKWSGAGQCQGLEVTTSIKVYSGNVIDFVQTYTSEAVKTNESSCDKTVSGFPTFDLTSTNPSLGSMAFHGTFINNGNGGPTTGKWPEALSTGRSCGPHVLFDLKAAGKDAVVVSPSSNFMAQVFEKTDENTLSSGIMGSVTGVPNGFSLSTMLFHGDNGVNNVMSAWGTSLRKRYNKTTDVMDKDLAVRYLGYNTDHGAYYYYHSEPGKNMMETLYDVRAKGREQQIPYRYILLDSWWYYKGVGGGVANWTVRPDVFPPGGDAALKAFTEKTQWPVTGHNRYWSSNTGYAKKNGGDWEFSDDGAEMVVPMEQGFWDYLLGKSKAWGLSTYEQDWLYNEFNGVPLLQRDPTWARRWLMQMGSAAQKHGLTIQYCMAYPRHALQSVEIQQVTQIRSSDDYVPGRDKTPGDWNLGGSSILAHALALAPFKDNYWTSSFEPGGSCGNTTEPGVVLHSAISSFSAGPVTPSDGIAYANKSLIMMSATSEGRLLQPDRPMTYADDMIAWNAAGDNKGHLWTSYTTVGSLRFDIVFTQLDSDMAVTPSQLTLDGSSMGDLYYYREGGVFVVQPFSASAPIKAKASSTPSFHVYYTTRTLTSGWALLGEVDKWVPVASARFTSITDSAVGITGGEGEVVTVYFSDSNKKVVKTLCTIPASKTATISLPTLKCQ